MTAVHNLPPPASTDPCGQGPCEQTDTPGATMTDPTDGTAPRPFQLLALTTVRRSGQPVSWRHLGHYPDLETAVRARIEDVLAQLAVNDGWLLNAQHLIIGPGDDGPATLHCYVSEVGADPSDDKVPSPHNEPALRQWLLSAHRFPC
jgi:hypothetical protein